MWERSSPKNYQQPAIKIKVFSPSPASSSLSAEELLYLPALQTSILWRSLVGPEKSTCEKMEVADATRIQMVMPTPPTSEQAEPSALAGAQPSPAVTPQATPVTSPAPTSVATPVTPNSRQSTPDSPLGSIPTPPPSPPPARSEEAVYSTFSS
ncbi:hypothetical protein V6N13_034092 [Hibiscus sabdariffa]